MLKSTVLSRDRVYVEDPHSISIVRLITMGIRVVGVTSFSSRWIFFPSSPSRRRWISVTRSTEKPTRSFFSLIYENGKEAVGVPAVNVPVRLIFWRTDSARAMPARGPRRAKVARVRRTPMPTTFGLIARHSLHPAFLLVIADSARVQRSREPLQHLFRLEGFESGVHLAKAIEVFEDGLDDVIDHLF